MAALLVMLQMCDRTIGGKGNVRGIAGVYRQTILCLDTRIVLPHVVFLYFFSVQT